MRDLLTVIDAITSHVPADQQEFRVELSELRDLAATTPKEIMVDVWQRTHSFINTWIWRRPPNIKEWEQAVLDIWIGKPPSDKEWVGYVTKNGTLHLFEHPDDLRDFLDKVGYDFDQYCWIDGAIHHDR